MTATLAGGPWDELGFAIERGYLAFISYPQPRILHSSPLKDAEAILCAVTSAPLRQLDGDQLHLYAGSAIWTVGDLDDYRHFLPRILELSAENAILFSPTTISAQLETASWRRWPPEEQKATQELFKQAWRKSLSMHPDQAVRDALARRHGASPADFHVSPYPAAVK